MFGAVCILSLYLYKINVYLANTGLVIYQHYVMVVSGLGMSEVLRLRHYWVPQTLFTFTLSARAILHYGFKHCHTRYSLTVIMHKKPHKSERDSRQEP